MGMATHIIAYGAQKLSDRDDANSNACPVIGLFDVSLESMDHRFALTTINCP